MQVILEAKLYAIFSMMDLNYKNEEKENPATQAVSGGDFRRTNKSIYRYYDGLIDR